jgi:hypothetical protein
MEVEDFYVKTYLDNSGKGEAEYFGRKEKALVPQLSYKIADCIIVTSWFSTETAALAYCEGVNQAAGEKRTYYLVQEFLYSDDRIGKAKIVASMESDDYPASHDGFSVNEKNGKDYITHVRTMWFTDRDVAARYVDAFNQDIQLAISVRKAG